LAANPPKPINLETRKHSEYFPGVKQYVEDSKWTSKAGVLLIRFHVIEIASNSDLLNKDFQKYFEQECRELRAPKVKLDLQDNVGKRRGKKLLVHDIG